MKLLIVRHAIAEDREIFAQGGQPDSERPLTERGRKRMRLATKGLHRVLEHIDLLATSPYTRAVQTAGLIEEGYDHLPVVVLEELVPDRPFSVLLDWLHQQDIGATIGLVGHEPHLSSLVAWLLTGSPESIVELKKGGACLLECTEQVAPGSATMVWLLTPRLLRALG